MSEELNQEIDIINLKFPYNIQRRPGMFIGSIEKPDVLLREVIDNSIDELYASKCNKIIIKQVNDLYLVMDNGRGIPIKLDPEEGITKTKMAVTMINTGSKFNKELTGAGVGQNGVGIKAVNALSTKFVIMSRLTSKNYKDSIPFVKDQYNPKLKQFYVLEFMKGIQSDETVLTVDQINERYGIDINDDSLMTVTAFSPDPDVFNITKCEPPYKNLSYVNLIMDKFYNRKITIDIDVNGSKDIVKFEPYEFQFTTEMKSDKTDEKVKVFITFENVKPESATVYSGSVNSLVVNQGKHIDLMVTQYIKAFKEVFNIDHSYITCGLRMNVVVLAGETDFSSQTKERLTKLAGITSGSVDEMKGVYNGFRKIFKDPENKDYFDTVVKLLEEFAARFNVKGDAKIIAKNKDIKTNKTLRKKVDTSVMNPYGKKLELQTFEGNSAGGTVAKVRDSKHQGLMFMRGYGANAINKNDVEFTNNAEYNMINYATGFGTKTERHAYEKAGKEFPEPIYETMVCVADADVDGNMITALQAAVMYSKYPHIFEEGRYREIETPLYKQDGEYYYFGEEDKLNRKKPFARFKGLGELDAEDAEACITTPGKRKIYAIYPDDPKAALELLTSSKARKELLIDAGVIVDRYGLGFDD